MRGPPVCLRDLTAEEASAVESLARSRTAPARRGERARIVWRASHSETPPAIAEALGLNAETVRRRIRRFNAEGSRLPRVAAIDTPAPTTSSTRRAATASIRAASRGSVGGTPGAPEAVASRTVTLAGWARQSRPRRTWRLRQRRETLATHGGPHAPPRP